MSTERMQVLELVRDGKVSAEDGMRLLEALGEPRAAEEQPAHEGTVANDPWDSIDTSPSEEAPREAKQTGVRTVTRASARIEQAAKQQATSLSLSYTGLTHLPPEIGQLTHLEELDASFTGLTKLPPEIGQLTNLRRLDASFTGLSELPPEIGRLKHLEELAAHHTGLTELPPEIGQLTSLQRLDASFTGLRELPPELDQLPDLELDIRNTGIG